MGAQPLAIDLFCGLGGWTEGLLAEGYRVVGFDLERHRYPARDFGSLEQRKVQRDGVDFNSTSTDSRDRSFNYANQCAVREAPLTGGWDEYPAQLVLQDVLTIHGRQFKDAALIVASPPCQEFSYMAMPWSKAKQKIRDYESGVRDVKQLTALFDACFRIQREASEAAGHHIPMVVENVRGAQRWVGRARWHFGSFYLWGDVPALMPMTMKRGFKGSVGTINGSGKKREQSSWDRAIKLGGSGHVVDGTRHISETWRSKAGQTAEGMGLKGAGDGWFNDAKRKGGTETGRLSQSGSKSPARKAASALIAKIPLTLSRYIANVYHPLH